MRIGVAREIKPQEYRVALTPAGARELVQGGHEVLVETGAGLGSAFPDETYERAGATIASVDDVWEQAELLLKVKEPIAARVRAAASGPHALHVPPHRRGRAAHAGARRLGRDRDRVRDGRDRPGRASAARADERDRRAPGSAGGRGPPREAEGRPRDPARRRRGRRAGARPRHRRRHGRLQRGRHRARHGRAGDDPRALGRAHALPRADPERARAAPHVLEPPDRGVDQGRGPHDRRRPHPRRARAEADHAGDARRR